MGNEQEQKNRFAVPALIAGIVGAVLPFTVLIPAAAAVLGWLGISQAAKLQQAGDVPLGRGLSIAGAILGSIYTVFGLYLLATGTF
jgi:hypothetical protein